MEYQGETSVALRNFANKNKKQLHKAKAKEKEEKLPCSASMLQLLRKDGLDFNTKFTGTSCIEPSKVQDENHVLVTEIGRAHV